MAFASVWLTTQHPTYSFVNVSYGDATTLGIAFVFAFMSIGAVLKYFHYIALNPNDRASAIQGYLWTINHGKYLLLYKNLLSFTLQKAKKIGGDTSFSAELFSFCISFALYYAVGLFLLSWVLGNGEIGNIVVLPTGVPPQQKWTFIGLTAVFGFVTLVISDKFKDAVEDLRLGCYGSGMSVGLACLIATSVSGFLISYLAFDQLLIVEGSKITASMAIAILVSSIGAGALLASGFGAMARLVFGIHSKIFHTVTSMVAIAIVTVVSIMLGLLTLANAGDANIFPVTVLFAVIAGAGVVMSGRKNAVAGVLSTTVIVLGCGIICLVALFYYPSYSNVITTLLIFTWLLPFFNGLFDSLSFGVSRSIGRLILDADPLRFSLLLVYGVIDLALAFGLLLMLAFSIALAISVFDLWYSHVFLSSSIMNVEEIIFQAQAAPLAAESLWITIMLWSTMLPTIIHATVIFVAGFWMNVPSRLFMSMVRNINLNDLSRTDIAQIVYVDFLLDLLAFVSVAVFVIGTILLFDFSGFGLADLVMKAALGGSGSAVYITGLLGL